MDWTAMWTAAHAATRPVAVVGGVLAPRASHDRKLDGAAPQLLAGLACVMLAPIVPRLLAPSIWPSAPSHVLTLAMAVIVVEWLVAPISRPALGALRQDRPKTEPIVDAGRSDSSATLDAVLIGVRLGPFVRLPCGRRR